MKISALRYSGSLLLAAGLALTLSAPARATGLLVPTDGSLPPLAIKYHRAEVKIKDRVAVTHIDQAFVNSTDRDLEATFLFPLPKGATVDDFYLYVNGKRTKGEILEKDRARNIYEGIVRRMQDPGLLEYVGGDMFQCRVYPVPRRGEQRIEIKFSQVMPFEGGLVKYVYPMRTDRQSSRTLQDFTMSVSLESKVPIKTVYSPSHQIYVRKPDDHRAVAGFETSAALLDRDFQLFFTVSEKDIGLNLLTYRERGEPGFFMIMASPKNEFTEREIIGKRITFVVDTSGSMAGDRMKYTREALKYCLNKLNPDDLFNVIRFSTDVEAFEKAPVSASKEAVQRALNFAERLEAAGGTAIDEALQTALEGHVKASEPNLVVFMTDGHPTVGETDPERILKNALGANKVGAKLFVFGVGDDLNTHLLDKLARENGADASYVAANQEIEQTVSAFYDKVSHPVLAELRLDMGSIHEFDVLPKKLPDLFKGSQLIVMGRFRNDGHSALTLTGLVGKDAKRFVYEGAFPKEQRENDFIPRLWATRKIGFLLDQIRLGGERKELVDEVIALSKRYGIVTPYTSYLVTEDTPQVAVRDPGPRPSQPLLPAPRRPGWGDEEAGGGGRRGGPSADAPASAPPAKMAKAEDRMQVMAKPKGRPADALGAVSGAEAVTMADALKDMRSADKESAEADDVAGIRYAGGRSFGYRNGLWVDLEYTKSMQVLKVKYMGKAFFALLAQSPRLKQVFSLGERLIVVVGKGRAIEIGPDGRDDIPESEWKPYLP
jgi:Ca-activated chloride channel family protein